MYTLYIPQYYMDNTLYREKVLSNLFIKTYLRYVCCIYVVYWWYQVLDSYQPRFSLFHKMHADAPKKEFFCNIFCLFSMHKNLAYTFPIHTPTQEILLNVYLYMYLCSITNFSIFRVYFCNKYVYVIYYIFYFTILYTYWYKYKFYLYIGKMQKILLYTIHIHIIHRVWFVADCVFVYV